MILLGPKDDENMSSPNTMMPEEIVAKFANSLEQFEPINRQPSNTDLTRIREVVAPLLLQIPYDETGAVHNLIEPGLE